jgi:hypothetical protein
MQTNGLNPRHVWGMVCLFVIVIVGITNGAWIDTSGELTGEPVNVTVLKSDATGTEFMLSVNGVQSDEISINGDAYSRLSIPGESTTWQQGSPELPKVVKVLAIPPTGNVELHVEAGDFTIINGINVPPYQEDDLGSVVEFGDEVSFDREAYARDSFYPNQLAQISQPMIARDLRVVAVTMYPVQYNPVTHQLKIYSDISVTVENTGGTGINEKHNQHQHLVKSMVPFYRNEVLNYDRLGIDDSDVPYGTILIVCYNNASVLSEVNMIADWKRKKGYNVEVATTTATGTSSSSILNYILSRYNDPNLDPPLEYVMIVGDATGSWPVAAASTYSDFDYSLLEGSDHIADISVGRLSFEGSIDQLTIIRKKILKYESDPYMGGPNPDWLQDAWMYAGTSHGTSTVHTMQYVRQLLYSDGYVNIPLDTHSGHVVEATINTRLNSGVGIWNHRPNYISEIYCTDVDELSNGWMMPVCLNLTCGTGNWTYDTAISECLLRAGTTVQPKGAIAAIATATSGTHTAYNNVVDGSFFHALITLGQYNVGDALSVGKAHFLWQYTGDSYADNFVFWNNLMGDPSLEVWTNTPKVMNASFPSTISVGTNMIQVSVTEATDRPLPGAYVNAYKRGETLYGEMTGATGQVVLPITATTADTLFITVSNHDYKSVVSYALVQNSAHNLAPVSRVIDDDNVGYSHGNSNGIPNPGEGLEINVTLKNWGSQSVTGVTATITGSDPYVTSIGNATVSYGTIAAGGQVTPTADFEVTLSPTIPDGHQIELPLTITDNTLSTYNSLVVLNVNEVALEYVSHTWVNAGNGVFDAGETVNLEVGLENTGHANASLTTTGIARVNHPLITVVDSIGNWPSLSQGASGTNSADRFQLYADGSLYSGTPFQVTLYLQNAAGFRDTVLFNDIIGTPSVTDPLGPDTYGYYAFDNGDVFFSKHPSYSWVELDPSYSGNGTLVSIPDYGENQDASVLVNLPFNVQYYGQTFNTISVCSNGWFAFGNQTSNAYPQNWRIPGALGAMSQVSAYWDDFYLSSSGDGRVWQRYDSANHRFIIEWSRVYNSGSAARETFEAILYNENYYPTPTNDAEILFQYNTVTNGDYNDHYASVGIDNQEQTIGIEYTYNNQYPAPAASLMNGRAILFTTERGSLVDPPNIVVDPLSIEASAAPGGTAEASVTIGNTGVATLDYSIFITYQFGGDEPVSAIPAPDPVRQDYIDYGFKNTLSIGVSTPTSEKVSGTGTDASGGPDDFGYMWIDSDEPGGPAYSWVDISGVGTNTGITGDDQNVGPFSLGFNFEYYGNTYNSVRVCSNGFLSFTSTATTYANPGIPSSADPNAVLSPFWDDLYPPSGGQIYYYQDTLNQRFIVQWNGVPHISSGGPYTFEAILYADGTIIFQYQTMVSLLNSATIGIESPSGTDGLQVAYNQNYVHNGLAIAFQLPGRWLTVEPLTGSVAATETDTLHLLMDATDMEIGVYQANITISNTDPNNSTVVVPVTFTVTDLPPAPPAAVTNLVVSIIGNHIALSWSPVTEDINGDPMTVTGYNIYADPDPSFVPGPGNLIGTSTTTSYLHTNATLNSTKLFYVVTAVN